MEERQYRMEITKYYYLMTMNFIIQRTISKSMKRYNI